jgi:hypothetical protein
MKMRSIKKHHSFTERILTASTTVTYLRVSRNHDRKISKCSLTSSQTKFYPPLPTHDAVTAQHKVTHHHAEVKRKAIPVTSLGSLQGCEPSRNHHCLDNRLTEGGDALNLTRRQCSTPQKYFPCAHFCYRLSQPQDHSAVQRIK